MISDSEMRRAETAAAHAAEDEYKAGLDAEDQRQRDIDALAEVYLRYAMAGHDTDISNLASGWIELEDAMAALSDIASAASRRGWPDIDIVYDIRQSLIRVFSPAARAKAEQEVPE